MKIWKAVLMFLLAGALGYYYYRSSSEAMVQEQTAKPRVFDDLEAQEIRGIRGDFAGGSYEIVKVETTLAPEEQILYATDQPKDRWVLFFPPGAPVDGAITAEIVQALVSLRDEHSFEEKQSSDSLVDIGIVPPDLQVTITAGKKKKIVYFGKEHPVTKRRYMQIEGKSKIYLVAPDFYNLFRNKAASLRLSSPIKCPVDRIKQIEISNRNDESYFYLRSKTGAWSIGAGKDLSVAKDSAAIDKLVLDLLAPSITSYIDGELPDEAFAKLKNPLYRVEVGVEIADGRQKKFRFALSDFPEGLFNQTKEVSDTMYLFRWQSSPWSYSVRRSNFSLIGKNYLDFLSKDLFDKRACEAVSVSALRFSGAKAEILSPDKLNKLLCSMEVLSFSRSQSETSTPSATNDSPQYEILGSGSRGQYSLKFIRPISPMVASSSSTTQESEAPYIGSLTWGNSSPIEFEISSYFVGQLDNLVKHPLPNSRPQSSHQGGN